MRAVRVGAFCLPEAGDLGGRVRACGLRNADGLRLRYNDRSMLFLRASMFGRTSGSLVVVVSRTSRSR
jgi:hypothetical protein